jgi:hypothetical protein
MKRRIEKRKEEYQDRKVKRRIEGERMNNKIEK